MARVFPLLLILAGCLLLSPIGDTVAQKQSEDKLAVQSSKSPALLIVPLDKATAPKKQQEWAKHLGK